MSIQKRSSVEKIRTASVLEKRTGRPDVSGLTLIKIKA